MPISSRKSGIKSQEFATLRQGELLDSIGKKAEVTDANEAIGKQKVWPCSNPAAVIQGQSAGGDKTVNVKMVFEGLVPGVQHSDDSHRSFKTSTAKLKQRFTDGFKEKTEQNLFVGQDQAIQFVR